MSSMFRHIFGYWRFSFEGFTDIARKIIAESNRLANQNEDDVINASDIAEAIVLVKSPQYDLATKIETGRVLPFSHEAKNKIMSAWKLKNRSLSKFLDSSHLESAFCK